MKSFVVSAVLAVISFALVLAVLASFGGAHHDVARVLSHSERGSWAWNQQQQANPEHRSVLASLFTSRR